MKTDLEEVEYTNASNIFRLDQLDLLSNFYLYPVINLEKYYISNYAFSSTEKY